MAKIQAFRGVRYNQRVIKDLSLVICPPYDIISPQMQQELYQRSPYNFVRVEHSLEFPQDSATDNKYTRSAATLEQWLDQGILKFEEKPALYLYDHYFTYQGKEYKRRSIIANVRLEEWDKGVIRPHEGTLGQPKSDRVNLIRACHANSSPILSLFEDGKGQVASLLVKQSVNKPAISFRSLDGEKHQVWAITETETIKRICQILARQPLYIADGHHRYESALTYRREQMASHPLSKNAPFNYVMMTLVDFSNQGLLILPPHRLARGISKILMEMLLTQLNVFFDIEELPLKTPGIWQKMDKLLSGESNQDRLILFGPLPESLLILKVNDFAKVSQMMPFFHTELYKRLTVSVVDHVLLEKLLGVTSEQQENILAYTYDKQEAINRVLDQEYQLAVILGQIKPKVVKAIADAGERMPRKSTYFYPKLPSGLVVNRW